MKLTRICNSKFCQIKIGVINSYKKSMFPIEFRKKNSVSVPITADRKLKRCLKIDWFIDCSKVI